MMLLAAVALGSTLAAGATEPSAADRFLAALNAAAVRNDRPAIAGMVQYPIKTLISGWVIPIADSKTFITSFDAFFTEEIKDLVADAAAKTHHLKANEVLVLGGGALRAMIVDGRYRIIGIIPPPVSKKVRGARRGVTTVSFRTGESSAGYTGTLASGEHESYIVKVSRNELLDVRIERVQGRDVVARVLDAATHAPIDARARDGARVWTARVPATGDYLIDVVRDPAARANVLTYQLTVSVR